MARPVVTFIYHKVTDVSLPGVPGVQTTSTTLPTGNTTTLTHLVYLYGLVQNRTVGELMDTRGLLCYEYD